jgi:hypothetical protein
MSLTSNTVQERTRLAEEQRIAGNMNGSFQGKVAFVTGAGSGIGSAAARLPARCDTSNGAILCSPPLLETSHADVRAARVAKISIS